LDIGWICSSPLQADNHRQDHAACIMHSVAQSGSLPAAQNLLLLHVGWICISPLQADNSMHHDPVSGSLIINKNSAAVAHWLDLQQSTHYRQIPRQYLSTGRN
jgi:hypothetical protein